MLHRSLSLVGRPSSLDETELVVDGKRPAPVRALSPFAVVSAKDNPHALIIHPTRMDFYERQRERVLMSKHDGGDFSKNEARLTLCTLRPGCSTSSGFLRIHGGLYFRD
jgi:hypothetical protein